MSGPIADEIRCWQERAQKAEQLAADRWHYMHSAESERDAALARLAAVERPKHGACGDRLVFMNSSPQFCELVFGHGGMHEASNPHWVGVKTQWTQK